MKKLAYSAGKSTLAIVFWIGVWFVIAKIVDVELIVPTPLLVVRSLWTLIKTSDFWISTSFSFLRVAVGVILSLAVGCLTAFLTWRSKTVDTLLSPLLSIIKATPVASFIIIAWIWFDTSLLPIFISSLIVIPIITSNVKQGFLSIDKELVDVTRVYKLSFGKKLFKLYIPSVTPYFIAACKASLGMAWKASVAAEMIVLSKNSIGKEIYESKLSLEAAPVFAWTIVIIVLSIVIEKAFMYLINRATRKTIILQKGDIYAEN